MRMKPVAKIFLGVSLSLLAVGGALHMTGVAMGGRGETNRYFRDQLADDSHIGTVLEHMGTALNILPGHHWKSDGTDEKCISKTLSLDDFSSIKVDVDCADILVQEGEKCGIELSWNIPNYTLEYAIQENCLEITSESWGSNKLPNSFNIDCNVILILPADAGLEALDLSTDMGDVVVEGAVQVQKSELSTDLGDVICNGLWAEELDAETDLGDVWITLPGSQESYKWELETDLGQLSLNGETKSSGMGELLVTGGTGERVVRASSEMGSVDVSFS